MTLQLNKQSVPISNSFMEGIYIVFREECWVCGTNKDLGRHHCIPQSLKPNKNMTVPVCRACHNKIHGIKLNPGKKERQRKRMVAKMAPSKQEPLFTT